MDGTKEATQRYLGYPRAVEAPQIPYKKSADANPAVGGSILVAGAWLYVPRHPNTDGADIYQHI
jgi:hypothetical protein